MDMSSYWLPVVIAAVINMIIGYFWYSKWIFGPTWTKLAKAEDISMTKNMKKPMLFGFIASLVTAYFLAFFEMYLGVATVTDGMFVGFFAWLGFVATTQISGVIWCNRSFPLFLIDTGCKLLSYLVMSGILGA